MDAYLLIGAYLFVVGEDIADSGELRVVVLCLLIQVLLQYGRPAC
jgi:hypothetical protein